MRHVGNDVLCRLYITLHGTDYVFCCTVYLMTVFFFLFAHTDGSCGGRVFSAICVCVFFCVISPKMMQLGSPILI